MKSVGRRDWGPRNRENGVCVFEVVVGMEF